MSSNFRSIDELIIYIAEGTHDAGLMNDLLTMQNVYLNLNQVDSVAAFNRWIFTRGKMIFPQNRINEIRTMIQNAITKKNDEVLIQKGYTVTKYGYSTQSNDLNFINFSLNGTNL